MAATSHGIGTAPSVNGWAERVTGRLLTFTMLLLGFAGWAAYLGFDKDALFIEALKIGGPLAIGGIGGYYYGRGSLSGEVDGDKR